MNRCAWPECNYESRGRHNGKFLCDFHILRALSENKRISNAAAKTLGIPVQSVVSARIPSFAESAGKECGVPGCNRLLHAFVKRDGLEVAVCSVHYRHPELVSEAGTMPPAPKPKEIAFDWAAFESRLDDGAFDAD